MKNPVNFYGKLVRLLGFLPRRIRYYRLAFIPKSAFHIDASGFHLSNERLEYLGDAILDAIVADYLFTRFPNGDEGLMTKLRSRIVKRKTLDYLAGKVGIPRLITAGISPGNKSKHLYGNVLEALVGAIFLDRGYAPARRFFVAKVLKRHVDLEQLVQKDPDHKSRIIEWAQKNRIEVVFKSREEHLSGGKRPSFVSSVLVNGEKKGIGRGASKKDAEQVAAKEALKNVHSLP